MNGKECHFGIPRGQKTLIEDRRRFPEAIPRGIQPCLLPCSTSLSLSLSLIFPLVDFDDSGGTRRFACARNGRELARMLRILIVRASLGVSRSTKRRRITV